MNAEAEIEKNPYEVWNHALDNPDDFRPQDIDPDQIGGRWRMVGARTKPDWPVAIWPDHATGKLIVRIGNDAGDFDESSVKFDDFMSTGWLKCIAVAPEDYRAAVDTGIWADGKPAKAMTDAAKAGIEIPAGDNAPPEFDSLADQIKAAAESVAKIGEIEGADHAEAAGALRDRLRALFKAADGKRVEEKRPHDEAAAEVQAKWRPLLDQAESAGKKLKGAIEGYLRREQRKRDEEAAAERARLRAEAERREAAARKAAEQEARAAREKAAEEARIRAEAEGKAAAETEAQAKAAADAAEAESLAEADRKAAETRAEDEIAADRAAKAETVRVGASHGTRRGLRTVTSGKITDMEKFLLSQIENPKIIEAAESIANALARAGAPAPGMEIVKDKRA